MSKNYQKVCWQCGHEGLNDMGEYVWCPECQATFNRVPKLGAYPIAMMPDAQLGESPSPSVAIHAKH